MNVIPVKGTRRVYTSNVYLVLGCWNAIDDVNTLVDVGADPTMVDAVLAVHTGLGKKKVDRVILTHSHPDHTANLDLVRRTFQPEICAFSPHVPGVDRLLKTDDTLRLGDQWFDVIHSPCHSNDGILLHNRGEGILFSGDTPLAISTQGGTYDQAFIRLLDTLCREDIRTVFFGHGEPLRQGVGDMLRRSLRCATGCHEREASRSI